MYMLELFLHFICNWHVQFKSVLWEFHAYFSFFKSSRQKKVTYLLKQQLDFFLISHSFPLFFIFCENMYVTTSEDVFGRQALLTFESRCYWQSFFRIYTPLNIKSRSNGPCICDWPDIKESNDQDVERVKMLFVIKNIGAWVWSHTRVWVIAKCFSRAAAYVKVNHLLSHIYLCGKNGNQKFEHLRTVCLIHYMASP